MAAFIITSIKFDFEMFAKRADQDKGPRHALSQIALSLEADIYQPEEKEVNWLDRLLSFAISQPIHWALARRLLLRVSDQDIVYCVGEDTGIPIAILCKFYRTKPRLVVAITAPDRSRTRCLIKVLRLDKMISLFAVNAKNKLASLQNFLCLDDKKLLLLPEKTDELFFYPGTGTVYKKRPLIASAGLEQRDYKTLAAAIDDLEVDVKVCAVSPNVSAKTQVSMPKKTPDNMEIRYFDFSELRNLYRSADIVVISLLKNSYSAGLTVLMEAIACRRPVIITNNIGLPEELINKGIVVGAEPGDSQALKIAIQDLLTNPSKAKKLADSAYEYFLVNHSSTFYTSFIANSIKQIEPIRSFRKKLID